MALTKAQLRFEMRKRLSALSPDIKAKSSGQIRQRLSIEANTMAALFAGTRNEPGLLELIELNPKTTFYLPRITGPGQMDFVRTTKVETLRPGPYGILEPNDGQIAKSLDFILCPGLAFTREGLRLGQGGGYYDRALTRYPNARRIGVAFSCQILPSLPHQEHDIQMDEVITPDEEF